MAVRAGEAAGCGRIEELTLEAPLVLPADAAVQVQVVVGGAGDGGRRQAEVYARAEEPGVGAGWVRHASGVLAPPVPAGAGVADEFAVWPPRGAVVVSLDGLYEGLAAGGYGYGPAFRGLRAAWRRGDDVFAEVALPEAAGGPGGFGMHPALLDAALHAAGLAGAGGQRGDGSGQVRLPFAWTGVSLHAAGASVLRVRLAEAADGSLSLTAADGAGVLAVSVGSLALRPVAAGDLAAGGGVRDALFGVEWVPVPSADGLAGRRMVVVGGDGRGLAGLLAGLALAGAQVRGYPDMAALAGTVGAGEPAPEVVVLTCGGNGAVAGGDPAAAARAAAGQVLGLVQQWLGEERLASSRLLIVTRGAVSAVAGEGVADLAGAAVWGLVRSAQSENPGRLVLADLPAADAAGAAGTGDGCGVLAAALGSGEPELAVRGEMAYGRRLVRPSGGLVRPGGGVPWRLEVTRRGTLDGLALVACEQAARPLEAGQVRVAVRAAGVNFRDVVVE
jgi:hypothetical protein